MGPKAFSLIYGDVQLPAVFFPQTISHHNFNFKYFQIIKDWMLVIIVAGIVGLELIVMLVGTAIPESRITARPVLVDELRQNVSIIDGYFKE